MEPISLHEIPCGNASVVLAASRYTVGVLPMGEGTIGVTFQITELMHYRDSGMTSVDEHEQRNSLCLAYLFGLRPSLEQVASGVLSELSLSVDLVNYQFWHHEVSSFLLDAVKIANYCNTVNGSGEAGLELHLDVQLFTFFDHDPGRDGGEEMNATSASAISRLERLKYDSRESLVDQFGQEDCTICLGTLSSDGTDLTRMPCSHVFHYACLVQWLEQSNRCPLCRHEMLP